MSKKKISTTLAFQFSPTQQEVRSLTIDNEPFFVAKDVCDVLGIKNARLATATLDDDEKLTYKIYTSGQNRKSWLISESGLYALIMRSNKPEARVFRKWVTKEVLPSIRKKGYYGNAYLPSSFTDVRDVPYSKVNYNQKVIRVLEVQNTAWYSLTDIHKAIGSNTCATQASKKLNTKKTLAKKFWLFGATHPSWFTTKLGFQLIVSASKIVKTTKQISLEL